MTVNQANKLKIGDKVVCDVSFNDLPQRGWIGKVIVIDSKGSSFIGSNIGVEWEEEFSAGHSCDDRGAQEKCRYYFLKNGEPDETINILNVVSKQLELEF